MCGTACDDSFLEQDALRLHKEVAEVLVLVAPQRYLALNGLVSQPRDAQTVGARSGCQDVEVAAFVGHGSSDEGAVGSGEQLDGGLYHRLFQVGVEQLSADGKPTVFGIGLGGRCEQ